MDKYNELCAALVQRDKLAKELAALDRRVNELAGIVPESQTRKPKATNPKSFKQLCGVK